MALRPRSPLLKPVVVLRTEPIEQKPPSGGKKERHIVKSRLENQRKKLAEQVKAISASSSEDRFYGDKVLLNIEMYVDSLSVTMSPHDLLGGGDKSVLTRALAAGYLAEVSRENLAQIYVRLTSGRSIPVRCDISRVKSIKMLDASFVLRGRSLDELWSSALDMDGGKGFHVWLAPFHDDQARSQLLKKLAALVEQHILIGVPTTLSNVGQSAIVADRPVSGRTNSLSILERYYTVQGRGYAVIRVPTFDALRILVSSVTSFRMDPVQRIGATSPGEGAEPVPSLPASIALEPIVGIVDGGCNARRYDAAEAWRERAYVRDGDADHKHGNQVTSLVVHGHEWNNNLPLPELYCRFGVAQAVPRSDVYPPPSPDGLPQYIEEAIIRHPDTRVWNLSWNEAFAADSVFVSALGHELRDIARRRNILFVISAGNAPNTHGSCIAPPADCEAALVVGGRQFDLLSKPTKKCPISLGGYGPELRLVPHVSSFSPLRLLGGVVEAGTSFPTGLISSLAAHTFANLREPTPDLVKALIIDQCDQPKYDRGIGWGTPSSRFLPWNCPPGTVRMIFKKQLRAGWRYYWQEIPIPPTLRRGNKICGRVSLTVIHQPICVTEGGPSYISTRIGCAIQYPNRRGQFQRLVGMKENDDTGESQARSTEYKWQPTYKVAREFTKNGGITSSGSSFRLYARLFGRNMSQFGYLTNDQIPPLETVFIVSFSDGSDSDAIYDSTIDAFGQQVESAVLNQELDIDIDL